MADRHKRDADARRKPRAALVAGPLAVLATASVVTIGVITSDPSGSELTAGHTTADISGALDPAPRPEALSRGGSRLDDRREARREARQAREARKAREQRLERLRAAKAAQATERAVRGAHVRMWTTTALNLWDGPGSDASNVGLLDGGKRVLVTGRKSAERVELAIDGASRWVTAGYLSEDKPVPEKATPSAPAGLSTAPCPDSSVENGLTSEAVAVYRAVCHAFPQITTYGGYDAHGEHASGKAIDIMTSDQGLGDQIAAFLQSHASELDLYDIIWWDRIWTPERASEGWRDYGDHGSATANHMDHVHVSTNN